MKHSVKVCRVNRCKHLERRKVETATGIRMYSYCGITDKVPGNMSECPLGVTL
jgi:hypothetical protein